MSSILDKLKESRDVILLAEIGAYLHDLGKATREFIEYYSKDYSAQNKYMHHFPSIFPEKLREILKGIKLSICREEVSLMDFIEKHHPEKEEGGKRRDCEIPPIIRLLYAGWKGYDGIDSGLDKGKVMSREEVGQRKDYTFIATAFGYEFKKIELDKIEDITKNLWDIVKNALDQFNKDKDIGKLRKKIIEGTEEYYRYFLGETRRPANDVTLWDHSYSVATLVKCAVAKNVIDCSNASFDPLDFNWNVLSIDFDVLGLLAKGVKLGDTLGYWSRIEEAFNKVKEMVEVKYPIGNEIYRDTTGIFFLVSDIDLEELKNLILEELRKIEPELMPKVVIEKIRYSNFNYGFTCKSKEEDIPKEIKQKREDIERKKKEELKDSLPLARESALQEIAYPISYERFYYNEFGKYDWKSKEICPICRLRPMDENSDGCEYCLERRRKRASKWKEDPKNTIWLDEVSDKNDRIALIVGCFILDRWLDGSFIMKTLMINDSDKKNPSPARIRRCWETTQEFIHSTIFDNILKNWQWKPDIRRYRIQFKIEQNPDIPEESTCDIDVDGIRFSPVCIDKRNGIFVSTINLELLSRYGNKLEEILSKLDGKKIKIKTEKDRIWKEGKIVEARPAEERYQNYLPYVRIYDFPDQFMVLVPAYESLDIAESILREYEKQFSKVRDRLPLHLGIIAFHRKTPLYVAIDSGRRLLETFKERTETKLAEIQDIQDVQEIEDVALKKSKELTIRAESYSLTPLKWKISYSTGDPAEEDRWYPYIRIENNGCEELRYINELKKGDKIKIEPSYFRLLYLENTADRFSVDEDLRPLDCIRRLKELWEIIEDRLRSRTWSTSRVYAYWEEIKRRRKSYDGPTFEKFVKAALVNILKIKPQDGNLFDLFFQSTMDCSLDLCLYWNFQVRKIKVREGGGI